jgi:trans-2,3-dihydro-3-hydroxyanthranilate isomerase
MASANRTLKFYQADVFTDEPFGGNPVAVVPDAAGLADEEIQKIAREMNLSETVFVFPPSDPKAQAKIRIFTPKQEIPFAGHPVLGTFYVLASLKRVPLIEPITRLYYECNIGVFPVELRVHKGEILRVVMTQPKPEFLGYLDAPEGSVSIAKALGLDRCALADAKYPIEVVSTGLPVIIVPVRTLTAVRSIVPDLTAITNICLENGANGLMVFTTVTVDEYSTVHTRMFAPSIGIPEDPATGSASGALGAYLIQNGIVEVEMVTEIIAEQGYEVDRPSRIIIQVESQDNVIREVKVGGEVVMPIEGTITL